MSNIGHLFSSAARTEILRVLSEMKEGAGVREIARLAGVYPRSAQLTLAGLVDEKLVKRRTARKRTLYLLNPEHNNTALLEKIFREVSDDSIRARSRTLQERGRSILPFIDDAISMLRHAKKGRHDA